MKICCEFCGNEFEVTQRELNKGKRFCNNSCAAKWRNKHYGPNLISDETKKRNAEILRNRWQTQEFRENNHKRMTENNPTFNPETVAKIKKSQLLGGNMKKNYKYGNGSMSKYESEVYNSLIAHGYYYNYAITTKLYRDAHPEIKLPTNYKPDFTNLVTRICIEIDGPDHLHTKELDMKKDKCLKYLGFEVIRFTHDQLDKGELDKWLKSNQSDC